MKKLERLMKGLIMSILAIGVLTFSSCSDDDDPIVATQTLYELISDDANLTEMLGYIDADPALSGYAKGTAAYTIFAPNNAAFEKLRVTLDTDDLSTVAPALITSVMHFHFSAGATSIAELTGSEVVTSQGESVVGNSDGTILTGGSDNKVEILSADIAATNGVLHVVETILVPPTIFNTIGVNLGRLSQPILLGASFTILAEGLAKADEFASAASLTTINSLLSGETVYTVFAPTNATFEAGSITAATFSGQQWYGIILNHMVAGSVGTADLTACKTINTLLTADGVNYSYLQVFNNTDVVPAKNGVGIYFDSNQDIVCDLSDGGASLETGLNAELALPDAFTGANGSLHVIAGVLAPAQ